MVIKLSDALNIYQTLGDFLEQKMSINLSYKIMKIMTELEPEINFYRDKFSELVSKYGAKDENGEIIIDDSNQSIQISAENVQEFNEANNELTSIDVELGDHYLSLDELGELELSPKQIYTLTPLIEE